MHSNILQYIKYKPLEDKWRHRDIKKMTAEMNTREVYMKDMDEGPSGGTVWHFGKNSLSWRESGDMIVTTHVCSQQLVYFA